MKEKKRCVSVIIPVYNGNEYIERALDSVYKQTYKDIEIIIVDDGSSDNSFKKALEYLEKADKKINYIITRYSRNKGVSRARNTGILLSNCEYIAFLDQDDEWLDKKLELQVKTFEESSNSCGLVYCGIYQIDENNEVRESPFLWIVRKTSGKILDELKRGNFIVPSMVMIRRNVFECVGLFDEKFKGGGEDTDLWIRIANKYEFCFIREPLVVKNFHKKNKSAENTQAFNRIKNLRNLAYKHFKDKDELLEFLSNYENPIEYILENNIKPVVFGCGSHGRMVVDMLKNSGVEIKFLADNNKNIWGHKVKGIVVQSPDKISKDDFVIIASSWWKEIREQLISKGINKLTVI